MTPSRSWGLLSALPGLSIAALWLTTNQAFRWQLKCTFQHASWIGPLTVAACALALFAFAATLTFATEAAGNRAFSPLTRFGWVMLLIAASPLSLPLYWSLHLRSPAGR